MLGFLLGLEDEYTKFSYVLCLWNSKADAQHYIKREWPARETFTPGTANVRYEPLVPRNKIPPLHIKLGLVKQFVKALDPSSEAFRYIRTLFPKLSDAKIKAGIFIGPQMKQMLPSQELENIMSAKQKALAVVHGFLSNHKSKNYKNNAKPCEKLSCT